MTIVITICRQVNVANTFNIRRSLTKGVCTSYSMSNLCSSNVRKQIFVTRPDLPKTGLNMLEERYDVTMWSEESPIPRQELLKQLQGKDALFCMLTDKIDKEVLDNAGQNLKIIGTMSVGYDHIDVSEVKSRGIKLGYTPDVLTDAVAELTIALTLATSRRLFEAHQEILDGKWSSWAPTWMCGVELKRSTVGIVGFGRIGQGVASRLKAFSVDRILYSGRSDKPEAKETGAVRVPLETLLSESDFVIVTSALTPETKEMFDDTMFAKMKPTAIFINTSRGGLVDQQALQRALENGTILAAGLDVTTPEPLLPSHPLLSLKNCVIVPHIGSATTWARGEMCTLTARNIIAALENQPMPAEVL